MLGAVDPTEFDPHPMGQLRDWLAEARAGGEPMPEAMTLATATPDGRPSARMVILRGLDDGAVFYTDRQSLKGTELEHNPRAALVWHWLRPVHRQVRVVGPVSEVSAAESDAYWRNRPPAAQVNMTASLQSHVIGSRAELEAMVESVRSRSGAQTALPRPERWCGWRVAPDVVELWEEAADGLHDRIRYRRSRGMWVIERLAP